MLTPDVVVIGEVPIVNLGDHDEYDVTCQLQNISGKVVGVLDKRLKVIHIYQFCPKSFWRHFLVCATKLFLK